MKNKSTQTESNKSLSPNPENFEVPYTPQGEHPEDRIFKDGDFIRELAKVQDMYFEKLVEDLGLNQEGETWLFDHIFNGDKDLSFDEFLYKMGVEYKNLLKNPEKTQDNPKQKTNIPKKKSKPNQEIGMI